MKGVTVYDPELLRTFLAVAQSLSFTRAAASLGLGQPTVSQHVRKLEDAVGRPLFVRDTRSVTLTVDGEAMAGFARSILAAHEQAVGYFTGSGISGRIRFGVTDDLALTPVPSILRDFRQLYPRIDLELTVSQSNALQRRVESGHLDVAFVKQAPGEGHGRLVRRDRLVWAAPPGTRLTPRPPASAGPTASGPWSRPGCPTGSPARSAACWAWWPRPGPASGWPSSPAA
jgi:DNA-binding transcriptional LysR family regulator